MGNLSDSTSLKPIATARAHGYTSHMLAHFVGGYRAAGSPNGVLREILIV
jgi:hypothetical protein